MNLPILRFLAAHLSGFAPERMMPRLPITLGMTLTHIYRYVGVGRPPTQSSSIDGRFIGLGGYPPVVARLETPRAVPWWLAFLIVTIVGESAELARPRLCPAPPSGASPPRAPHSWWA